MSSFTDAARRLTSFVSSLDAEGFAKIARTWRQNTHGVVADEMSRVRRQQGLDVDELRRWQGRVTEAARVHGLEIGCNHRDIDAAMFATQTAVAGLAAEEALTRTVLTLPLVRAGFRLRAPFTTTED